MTLEGKIQGHKEHIDQLEKQLDGKNQQIKKMHDAICQQELRFESLRDPTGLQQFKRLINSFTSGIDSIYAEKEQQYTTMKAVVQIMGDMNDKKDDQDPNGEKSREKMLISRLKKELEMT